MKNQLRLLALLTVALNCCLWSTAAYALQPFKWPTAGDQADPKADAPAPKPASTSTPDPSQTTARDLAAQDTATVAPASTVPDITDKSKPFSPVAIKHYNRGVELHQSGFLNQAIEVYKQALAADPRIEQAWSNLGGIYVAQRSYTKAMDAFEKAYQLNPNRATTLNGMATVLYARGKIDDAKEKWKQAVQIDPKFASAYYNIGNAYEGEKKPLDAIEWYVKAFDINAKMADAIFRVGCIYVKEKHPAQAEIMLEKAIETAPDAEFVKEARRLLSQIHTDYQKDMQAQGEVRMRVLPPTESHSADGKATASAPNTVSKAEQSASVDPVEKHMHKKKKHKNDPAASDPDGASTTSASTNTDASSDLQQKPTQ